MKIRYKLLILLIITVAVPLFVSLFISYYSIQDRLTKKYMETNKTQVDQTSRALQLSFDDIDRKLLSVYQTTDFYKFMMNPDDRSYEWLDQQKKTLNLLQFLGQSLNRKSDILLYIRNFDCLYKVDGKSLRLDVQDGIDDKKVSWIKNSVIKNGKFTIEKVSSSSTTKDVPLAIISRSVSDVLTNKNIGALAVNINSDFFTATIGEDLSREYTAITDARGDTVFQTFNDIGDLKQYLAVKSAKNSYGWQIIKYVPRSLLKEAAWGTVNPILFWGMVFLLVGIALSLIISLQISKPIIKLTQNMVKASKGDFKVDNSIQNKDDSQNEIDIMSAQFNLMLTKIDELIKNEYKLKIKEYSARMEALQAQINPHFLYNTLMTIYSEALYIGSDSICKMVKTLSSILRYTIEGEKNIVRLGDEIEHIKNYLEIQKFRYDEKLSYSIDIPEHFLYLPAVKLSIQPIVENAIIHGIAPQGKGTVRVSAISQDEQIKLVVEDDGAGILPEKINAIQEKMHSDSGANDHIGIYNVHQRILYSFPGSTGISFESLEGSGTKVIVEWKVAENGQDSYSR